MYSAISKLLLPVIASMPLKPLMLDLFGRLLPSIVPMPEFVTHGGFPMNNMLLLRLSEGIIAL